MLDELGGWDLHASVLLADSGYGEVGEFRGGLDARGVSYVAEVRSDTGADPQHVHPVAAPYSDKGRRLRPRYHHQPSSLKELAVAAGRQACVELSRRRGSKGLQRGRFLHCGCARPGSPHAGRHARMARSCRCVSCWSNGPVASPS